MREIPKGQSPDLCSADVDAETDEWRSVLVFATGKPETEEILIGAGADVNAKDDGQTAPSIAKRNDLKPVPSCLKRPATKASQGPVPSPQLRAIPRCCL